MDIWPLNNLLRRTLLLSPRLLLPLHPLNLHAAGWSKRTLRRVGESENLSVVHLLQLSSFRLHTLCDVTTAI